MGVLFATGFMLVAVRGRAGWENTLLDLAGMLLPVVAVIPAVGVPGSARLPGGGRATVEAYVPYVERSLTVVLVLGPVLLALAWWVARQEEPAAGVAPRIGVGVATLAWAAAASAAWDPFTRGWHEVMFRHGHNVAAITAFGLMTVVAVINARASSGPPRSTAAAQARMTVWFRRVYAAVATWMAGVVVVAGGIALRSALAGVAAPVRLVFWVEVLLLIPFAIFWAAQTWEFWNRGLPREA